MTGFIPVPPDPWVPTATDSETKLFPDATMTALDEHNDGRYATTEQGEKADSAYQLPEAGVPVSDLEEAVQTSLGKADEAVPNTVAGRTALAASPELGAAIDVAVAAGVPAEVAAALADQPEVLAAAVALAQSDAGLARAEDAPDLPDDWTAVRGEGAAADIIQGSDDGREAKVAGLRIAVIPDESEWAFLIQGPDMQTGFGIRKDGTTFPEITAPQDTDDVPWYWTGDSLTANRPGFGSDAALRALLGRDGKTDGVGSQTVEEINARTGPVPALLTVDGNIIPETGSVSVTAWSANPGRGGDSGTTRTYDGLLAGIPGTLSVVRTGGTTTMFFERSTPGDAAYCPPGTPFIRGLENRRCIPLLALGRNNQGNEAQSDQEAADAVLFGVNKALEFFSLDPWRRALIFEIPPSSTETPGTPARARLDLINETVRAAHPDKWCPDASWLRSTIALELMGITPTSQDLADIANDITPSSFRSDNLHYNETAQYARNIYIAQEFTARGWSLA